MSSAPKRGSERDNDSEVPSEKRSKQEEEESWNELPSLLDSPPKLSNPVWNLVQLQIHPAILVAFSSPNTIKFSYDNSTTSNVIFNLKLEKIDFPPMKRTTPTSIVGSYTVFVYDDGRVFVKDNSIAILPTLALENTTSEQAMFCDKTVELCNELRRSIKTIFLVVNARINVANGTKEENRRNKAKLTFETVIRYGAKMMYDKDTNVNKLDDGKQEIVLVNEQDHPEYANIFGKENKNPSHGWMENVEHLKSVDRANQEEENAHLPQLIMTTDVPENGMFGQKRKRQTSSNAKVVGVLPEPKPEVDNNSESAVKVEDTLSN